MRQIFHIFKYIVQNNSLLVVPYRLLLAILYQAYKRLANTVFTKSLFNGQKIFLYPHNTIASSFIYASYPDKAEIHLLRGMADKQSVFLDIGANIGAYSILLMDKVKAVYAFEAHPGTANLCKMNFLLNGISESQVISAAVSDSNQPLYFSNLQNGDPLNTIVQEQQNAISVPAITLDQFIQTQAFTKECNFLLKIDVEGFEHAVLLGAKEFLKSEAVKAILLETFSEKHQEIQGWLEELGFKMRMVSKHNLLAYR